MSMPAEHLTTTMTLDKLLEGIAPAPALPVADITCDSRRVLPGALFLACPGAARHGIEFAADVAAAGAAAVAWDPSTADAPAAGVAVPLIAVPDLASRLGMIADRFFGAPSAAVDVVGITGTNGKTTVAWMLARALDALGIRAAYSGTLGYGIDELEDPAQMTTPDVVETHRRLAAFHDGGASSAAIEVSSHALDQRRVDAVRFDAAIFTNLTREHLDYHGSMQAYGAAKTRLFTEHEVANRIINLDSEFGTRLAARCGENVTTVSTRFDRVANGRPYLFARSVVVTGEGSRVRFDSAWGSGEIRVPVPGEFNVANALLVLACLLARGVEPERAALALSTVAAPPGRLELVCADLVPAVYIDYAHTPNALDSVLAALSAHCRGRLWCVFGCGGERDRGKRSEMGRIGERLADRVVVTSDNPRGEDPLAIIGDIVGGLRRPDGATVIEDRATAIAWAIGQAGDDDVVLIAGKGHERYQLVGSDRIEFSDTGIATRALEHRRGRSG